MLGARIDVIQPQMRNLIAYLLQLPNKKTTTVVKRDKTSRLNRKDRQNCSRLQCTLLIRKDSIKYWLLLLWARLKISWISRLCCVWSNVYVHVCKTTKWQFIIICNCIYSVGIGQVQDGGRCSGWWLKGWMSSSDITFLRKSQGLVKRHSYFMQAVCTLLWIDCFKTYMVVIYPIDFCCHEKETQWDL